MQDVVHTIRRIARDEAGQRPGAALGVVKSVHGRPAGGPDVFHACTVQLRETGIVLPKVPIATGLIGVAALPAEGDLVVVVFAGGDLHAPVVVGRLHSDRVDPPEHGPGEVVAWLPGGEEDSTRNLQFVARTPGDGTRSVRLTLDGSVKVEVLVDDGGVVLQAQDCRFSLTQSGGSDGKAELAVGQAKVTVEQGGDVTVEAGHKLTLKGAQVEITGDTSVKVAGQTIDLN
jgi:hypothetical protein